MCANVDVKQAAGYIPKLKSREGCHGFSTETKAYPRTARRGPSRDKAAPLFVARLRQTQRDLANSGTFNHKSLESAATR